MTKKYLYLLSAFAKDRVSRQSIFSRHNGNRIYKSISKAHITDSRWCSLVVGISIAVAQLPIPHVSIFSRKYISAQFFLNLIEPISTVTDPAANSMKVLEPALWSSFLPLLLWRLQLDNLGAPICPQVPASEKGMAKNEHGVRLKLQPSRWDHQHTKIPVQGF